MGTCAMSFGELEVLTDETMRKACGNTDLIKGKRFFVQQDDTGKILDVATDSSFTMAGTSLDIARTDGLRDKDRGFEFYGSVRVPSPDAIHEKEG